MLYKKRTHSISFENFTYSTRFRFFFRGTFLQWNSFRFSLRRLYLDLQMVQGKRLTIPRNEGSLDSCRYVVFCWMTWYTPRAHREFFRADRLAELVRRQHETHWRVHPPSCNTNKYKKVKIFNIFEPSNNLPNESRGLWTMSWTLSFLLILASSSIQTLKKECICRVPSHLRFSWDPV